jgi:CubicO group peptidase (beta-lactamase class C family)
MKLKDKSTNQESTNQKMWKVLFLCAVCVVLSQNPVDRIFEQFKENTPGCAVGVVKDGHTVFEKGYGLRNLEEGLTNNEKNVVFAIGSITKQFTGLAIAMLIEEGRVSEEDVITKYFPTIPMFGQEIKVHHLLHHTSGYISYDVIQMVNDQDLDFWTDVNAMDAIHRGPHLNHLPGEKMSYTNTGYMLLGKIVEKVTNMTLTKFMEDFIFKPLEMANTILMNDHRRVIKRVANAYANHNGNYVRDIRLYDIGVAGSAGIWTTLDDMAKYDANFYNNKLGRGGPALIQRIQRTRRLNNGEANSYAYGVFVTTVNGSNVVMHGGAISGYRGDFIRFPEKKLTVNLLCNVDSVMANELSQKVAALFLNQKVNIKVPATDLFVPQPAVHKNAVSEKNVTEFAGIYFSREIRGVVEFKEQGSVIRLDLKSFAMPFFFKVNADDTFVGVDFPFVFGRFGRQNGKVSEMTFNFADRLTRVRYVKVARRPECI